MIAVGVESNCMHFNGMEREGVKSICELCFDKNTHCTFMVCPWICARSSTFMTNTPAIFGSLLQFQECATFLNKGCCNPWIKVLYKKAHCNAAIKV